MSASKKKKSNKKKKKYFGKNTNVQASKEELKEVIERELNNQFNPEKEEKSEELESVKSNTEVVLNNVNNVTEITAEETTDINSKNSVEMTETVETQNEEIEVAKTDNKETETVEIVQETAETINTVNEETENVENNVEKIENIEQRTDAVEDTTKENIRVEDFLKEDKYEAEKLSNPKEQDEVKKDILKNENANKENEKNIKKLIAEKVKKVLDNKEKKEKKGNSEKPEYVKEMLKIKKRKKYIVVCAVAFFLLVMAFSTGFAISNIGNSSIIKGVKIKDIEVSKLSTDEARTVLNEAIEKELASELKLKYGENYNITIKPEQIEFKYNTEEAVQDAYNVGRNGNIFKNNYKILGSALFSKKVELGYTYNEELLNNFVDKVNSEIPGVVVEPSHYIEDKNLFIEKGKDGVLVDKEQLKELIIGNIDKRTIEEVSKEGFSQEIGIPVNNAKASAIDVDKVYAEVFREPKNAYFETNPYKIYVDVDGIDFAKSIDEVKAMVASEDKEEYTVPLKISKAEITIQDLGKEAFPYLISSFSTKYDASNVDRSTNLQIAAGKINGRVLVPGEEFSFNAVVGKRTIEEGYKDAKIYADGGVVDGLAGGICQISSTLYNAALLANLEIVERKNHSYPASYIQVGRDATVVYGVKDLKFKNSRTYPIKLEASVKNGVAEFKIYGIKEEKEYEIKILPVTTGTMPFGTNHVPDPTLAPGQQVVTQSGHIGYRVTTYIEKRLDGVEVSKEVLSNDTYSPMNTIVKVGPAAAPAPAPAPVPAPDPNVPPQ